MQKDTVKNFENAEGGDAADIIYGSSAANVLTGNADADKLFGFGGNDRLNGGEGADEFTGGAGKDTLSGGGADGAVDTYIYTSKSDSGITAATRDTILDFEDDSDLINLDEVDDFDFIGVNEVFTSAGDLRVVSVASGWLIEGETTGDQKADFSIAVFDPTHTIAWDAGDFIL